MFRDGVEVTFGAAGESVWIVFEQAAKERDQVYLFADDQIGDEPVHPNLPNPFSFPSDPIDSIDPNNRDDSIDPNNRDDSKRKKKKKYKLKGHGSGG